MREKKLLGYYNYTVILTYLGLLIAFTGIICALEGRMSAAMICLMLAGVCDMFDGSVAATKVRDEREKRFGIQIDSLCDIVCFGVLPGILVYVLSDRSYLSFYVGGIYIICALSRLAYFNVLEEERQVLQTGRQEYYLGLPVTTVALLLPACYEIRKATGSQSPIIFGIFLFMMAIAFVFPIKIRKPYITGKIGIIFAGILEIIVLIMGVGLEV